MNKIRKKLILISFIMVYMMNIFACKKQNEVRDTEYRRFVDSIGREVSVKRNIKRIAVTGPLAQITVFPIAADKLVGVSTPFLDIAKKYFDKKYLELPVIGQLYGSSGSLNLETLISTGADIVIDVGAAKSKVTTDFDDIMMKTGIPMVHITLDINDIKKTYDILGDLLNEKDKAKEVGTYLGDLVSDTKEKMSSLNKKRIVYCLGEDGLNVIAEKSYFSEVINMVADNAAKIENPTSKGTGDKINIEELYNINPEYIIFDNKNIEKNVLGRIEWQKIDAIKNNKYYIVPESPFNIMGFPPAVQKVLGARWLMSTLYAEEVDIDIKNEFKTFFKKIYHCDIDDKEIEEMHVRSFNR